MHDIQRRCRTKLHKNGTIIFIPVLHPWKESAFSTWSRVPKVMNNRYETYYGTERCAKLANEFHRSNEIIQTHLHKLEKMVQTRLGPPRAYTSAISFKKISVLLSFPPRKNKNHLLIISKSIISIYKKWSNSQWLQSLLVTEFRLPGLQRTNSIKNIYS